MLQYPADTVDFYCIPLAFIQDIIQTLLFVIMTENKIFKTIWNLLDNKIIQSVILFII